MYVKYIRVSNLKHGKISQNRILFSFTNMLGQQKYLQGFLTVTLRKLKTYENQLN